MGGLIFRLHLKNHAFTLLKIALIAVVYFGTGKFGLSLNAVSGFAALIWPPAGIALAGLLICGFRVWPGIFIGATAINYWAGASGFAAVGIGVGNTLEALLGYFFLKKVVGFNLNMKRIKDVAALVVVCLVASAVSATVGIFSLLLLNTQSVTMIYETWNAWWIGDVLGILIITPLLVVWSKISWKNIDYDVFKIAEGLVLATLLYLVCSLVFGEIDSINLFWTHYSFWMFPLIVWCATRFGQIGSVTVVFAICALAIWKTAYVEQGPFVERGFHDNIFVLNCFLGVFSTTGYTLAAATHEKKIALATAEERQSLNSAFLTASLDAIVGINNNGDIVEFNPAAEKMFNYDKKEVIGKNVVNKLFPENFRNNIQQGIDNANKTGHDRLLGRRLEMPVQRSDQSQFPAEISFTLGSRINGQRSLIVYIRDISDKIQKQKHENLLLEAGKILNSSLDYQTTLSQIAKVVIPDLADWCLIDMVENEKMVRAVVSHKDHDKIELLFELRKKFELTEDSPQPAIRALKSGHTYFIEDVTDDVLRKVTFSEEHFNLMKKIGAYSHIATPMISRGEIVGILNLGLGPGKRKYTKADVILAEEIAARAALAVDNAKLYESLKNRPQKKENI